MADWDLSKYIEKVERVNRGSPVTEETMQVEEIRRRLEEAARWLYEKNRTFGRRKRWRRRPNI